jgi:hypothetical protein
MYYSKIVNQLKYLTKEEYLDLINELQILLAEIQKQEKIEEQRNKCQKAIKEKDFSFLIEHLVTENNLPIIARSNNYCYDKNEILCYGRISKPILIFNNQVYLKPNFTLTYKTKFLVKEVTCKVVIRYQEACFCQFDLQCIAPELSKLFQEEIDAINFLKQEILTLLS